jgi:hypothetical protein
VQPAGIAEDKQDAIIARTARGACCMGSFPWNRMHGYFLSLFRSFLVLLPLCCTRNSGKSTTASYPRPCLNHGISSAVDHCYRPIQYSHTVSYSATLRRDLPIQRSNGQLLFQHVNWRPNQQTVTLSWPLSNSRRSLRYSCDATLHKQPHTHPIALPRHVEIVKLWA